MLGGWWASKIFFTHKRGASSTFRLRFTLLSRTEVQSPWRFKLRKAPKEAVDPGFVSFSSFQEACPDLFLSRALPAAGCDSKLSLGSGMQSSELSRLSLAYPGPTEINLAWSVRTPPNTLIIERHIGIQRHLHTRHQLTVVEQPTRLTGPKPNGKRFKYRCV